MTGAVVFFDLEFTAWEDSLETGWSAPGRPAEILQIGAVLVDQNGTAPRRFFSCWVRPRINPTLSRYCRSLLGVEQSLIDGSAPLSVAMVKLYRWLGDTPSAQTCWMSWGREDLDFWRGDCIRAAALPPPITTYLDLMRDSAQALGLPQVCDRSDVKACLDVDASHRRHEALADAVDLIDIHAALIGRSHVVGYST